MAKPKRMASCHPEKSHYAFGFCFPCYQYQWNQKHPEQYLFNSARGSAKRKGLEFSISVDDIEIPEFCPVFPHIELDRVAALRQGRAGRRSPSTPSIDRIDNSKGYIPGNVRVISWRANRLKHNATPLELRLLYKDSVRNG